MSSSDDKNLRPQLGSLREKIAQLLMIRIGSNMPPVRTVADDEERVARLLEKCPVGGLLLFNGGSAAAAVLDRLQQASAVRLLVGADIERGVGQQVHGYPLFPHAMAFGQLPEDQAHAAVSAFAQLLAHDAANVGIHITFGPVADVNTNPRNPIVATRAYGEHPQLVARLVAAYIKSAQEGGLLATAKHFPGHGHTDKDSHETLPTVTRSLAELQACELMPFQAAIDARCALIMTAHVAYPALDPTGTPATYSPAILQDFLRREMKFEGAVCSDSLLMAGVRHQFPGEGQMALAVLTAGVDLLLDVEDPLAVIDYLCDCVDDGRLTEQRVDEALQRVWRLKHAAFRQPSWHEYARLWNETVTRGAIQVDHGPAGPALPLNRDEPLVAILLKPFETPLDPPEQPLAAALRERFENLHYVQLGPAAQESDYDAARRLAADAKQLVIAVIVRPAAWHSFGLRPEQKQLVTQLTQSGPAILASLGVPYVLEDYPQAALRICTYSDVPASQQALANLLSSNES